MIKPKVLAIIPARGGSKSIPRKNIKLLGGVPLIAYSIAAGLQSKLVNRVIVSTDDAEIADVAKKFGAEVPFVRPSEFAQDETPDFPVFKQALTWLKDNESYMPDIIVQLRPTSPIRPPNLIDESVDILVKNTEADSVRAVVPSAQNPYKMWKIENNGCMAPLLNDLKMSEPYNMPRQSLPKTFWQTGHIDVIRYQTIMLKNSMSGKNVLPLILDSRYAIDIDTELDWDNAEQLLKETNLSIVHP